MYLKKENSDLIVSEFKESELNLVLTMYKKALDKIYNELMQVKEFVKEIYNYDVINNIGKRIKTENSIMNKMKKKNYEINLKNMINNINDIAGIRIVCPLKSDIYTVLEIIEKLPDIKVIKRKDYIRNQKKSGYSGYHIIIETPVEFEGDCVNVKVEIQIRTMAMDFWATNEHKLKYKSNKKISNVDSKKMIIYAKLINKIDDEIMKIYQKSGKSFS